MATPAEYVVFLSRNGVKLWVDNGQLRYQALRGALSAEELARLRSMKNEIVAELSNATSATEAPLSFQQRWFLKLFSERPDWKTTLSFAFRLKGELDPAALQRSLEYVLRKHASLRTKIANVRGEWRLQTEPVSGFQLPILPVLGESSAERQERALTLIRESVTQELDSAVAPLMSAQLIRVSTVEHFLVVLVHRLATDCVGLGQAVRDLWQFYAEARKGAPAHVEESMQYRDYTLWQHATDEAWRQKHTSYWNDYLAEAQPIHWPAQDDTSLADRIGSREFVSLETSFGETLSARVRELGRQTQTLPALLMLSLYAGCISRWCGQQDLIIPFIIAGRTAAQDGVVGCFSHVVYLRIRLNGTENFIELLKRVSNEFYKTAAFRQDSGRIVTERPELLRGTLCQWLSWHPAEVAGAQTDEVASELGLTVESVPCQSLEELANVPPGRVDLEICFFEGSGKVSIWATCRTDRFTEGAPARLMREFESFAERAVRDPQAPIGGELRPVSSK